MPATDPPVCFLFDNGSLRAEATLGLRRLASSLAQDWGAEVRPVSLLHSNAVLVDELAGIKAELLETALDEFLARGGRSAVLLPLFFGPSGALSDYLPPRLAGWRERYAEARLVLAAPLVNAADPEDTRLASLVADRVRMVMGRLNWHQPAVLLTDHGSPQPAVTAVRDLVGRQVAELLREESRAVGVASMERRPGEAYAFNEPMLATALRTPPIGRGDVVVALLFLQPGRHAGPGGDIARICQQAEVEHPGLRTAMTEPLGGDDPRLRAILADRWREALRSGSWA